MHQAPSVWDDINDRFYETHAEAFSQRRQAAWQGWTKTLDWIDARKRPIRVLDVGCGNGRFAHALHRRFPDRVQHSTGHPCRIDYLGVDKSQGLSEIARTQAPFPGARFLCADVLALGEAWAKPPSAQPNVRDGLGLTPQSNAQTDAHLDAQFDFLAFARATRLAHPQPLDPAREEGGDKVDAKDTLPRFDVVVVWAMLHHIDGHDTRLRLLGQLQAITNPHDGLLALSTWRFDRIPRVWRKCVPLTNAGLGPTWTAPEWTAPASPASTAPRISIEGCASKDRNGPPAPSSWFVPWQSPSPSAASTAVAPPASATHPLHGPGRVCHLVDLQALVAQQLQTHTAPPRVTADHFAADGSSPFHNDYALISFRTK